MRFDRVFRRGLWAAMLAVCLSLPAAAEDVPTLYVADGLAPGQTLPITENRDGSGKILGEYPHDAEGIEVLQARGESGMVGIGYGVGWIDLRKARPMLSSWKEAGFQWNCIGQDHEWALYNRAKGRRYLALKGVGFFDMTYGRPHKMAQFLSGRRAFVARAKDADMTLRAVITPARCEALQGDPRSYRWGIEAFLSRPGQEDVVLTGCCSSDRYTSFPDADMPG